MIHVTQTTATVLLVADTHLGPGRAQVLIDRLGSRLAAADVILHAGDITDGSVLDALRAWADVHAVLGNNDRGLGLPERTILDLGGCSVAMVHDSGPSAGRGRRLHEWFPDADVVVFGHSHIPWNVVDVRAADGHVQHQINPGSATQRRKQPHCTAGWLRLTCGRVEEATIEVVG